MKRNYHRIIVFVLIAAGLAIMVGCIPVEMNGGGWIPSTSGVAGDKANFGFWGNSCDPDSVSGDFNYLDMRAPDYNGGVKLNGEVTEAAKCTAEGGLLSDECLFCKGYQGLVDPDDLDNVYAIEFNYDSTNPRKRGSGEGFACLVNNGEGFNAEADEILIYIEKGPYRHYQNSGKVQGNIATQTCPAID